LIGKIGKKTNLGLSPKTDIAQGSKKIVSFFNSHKKLLCNFLREWEKETFIPVAKTGF
jgi:hypothetical protein